MSTIPAPADGTDSANEGQLADVIALAPRQRETAEVEEMEPWEQVQLFLAQFRHPSMSRRQPEDVANIIIRQLYPFISFHDLESLSVEDLTMRKALLALAVDSGEMELTKLDQYAEADPIYSQMIDLTMATKSQAKDFLQERKALLGLEDFRLGTKIRSSGDIAGSDDDWRRIIALLFPAQSS